MNVTVRNVSMSLIRPGLAVLAAGASGGGASLA